MRLLMVKKVDPTKAYYSSAMGHCNAAKAIYERLSFSNTDSTDSTWIALQNVIGFAAENVLKCYLSKCGVDRKTLKDSYGHDLAAALQEACARGLHRDAEKLGQPELCAVLQEYITQCGPGYKEFHYRYFLGKEFILLEGGIATETVIQAIYYVLDIVEFES